MTRSAKGAVDRPSANVKAKSRLNRSILDQGWGMFATMLNYKLAERRVKFLPFE
jgi:putative transposase